MPDQSRNLTIVEAMREALSQEMSRDESVFVLGEDIRLGGSFQFTLGLHDQFGSERVLNTPISEAGFVGLAIGAAIQGLRPVVDFQYGDFVLEAADQLIQQAAKLRYMSGGQLTIPLVVHLPTGASGRGAQHAQSVEGFFFHVPGLHIVTPATPYDAKGLFVSALRSNNPVLFLVHKHTYGSQGRFCLQSDVVTGPVPEELFSIPLGCADIKHTGGDVTIVTNLSMLHHSLNVAKEMAHLGVGVEVVDLCTLVPLDTEMILTSVRKTRRLVIVHEDNLRGGWGAEVAAVVAEQAMFELLAPIKRVAAADTPIPFSPVLEASVIPNETDIKSAIQVVLAWEGVILSRDC
ncbi:MAG: alpha-ketoacid dehydrogenase subunit beta [Chloroflexi bacterium AL-W]|nr:alpha-ketoacid dehydrogenase subunit beta [Chloroflexi bacterium AL-N1]NOK71210.1 alpha-ketoacid dehydrogenase subunit beta [Chloroflexi bacterium AL-N10]NOK76499.1 alpha-ketoacid dehydrogenase subunit beta [Chloroflexi bacterium AL-N5]NOK83616.1 alpha-ketoacid dehydrogenase subunit beta [Chloroflexi bacterium AL-W]NOK92262.1 alpha-ketoacid dehydrogenase subunit beta [Chloroflexi bacterium AL-N15]